MKRILLPIDISKGSEYALEYGIQLSSMEHAELLILHAVSPMTGIESPTYQIYDFSEYLNERRIATEEYVYRIRTDMGLASTVKMEIICEAGHPIELILKHASEAKCDLIIMGSRGAHNISKILLGSTSQAVFGLSKVPLMIIPPEYKVGTLIKEVCFATDFHFKLNKVSMKLMTAYHFLANSLMHFVNVHAPGDLLQEDKHRELVALLFGHIKTKIKYIQSDRFEESLDAYMQATESGLLVVLPHQHNFLYHIFFRGHTMRILKKLEYPVLILYED